MTPEWSRKAKSRAAREKKTVGAMISLYCQAHHDCQSVPCADCSDLLQYAVRRIDSCPLIEAKPTCADCKIHCYEASRRERVRSIMRYSGPRMIYRHPVLSIRHLLDGRAKQEERV